MAFRCVLARVLRTPVYSANHNVLLPRLGACTVTSRNRSNLALPRVDYGGHVRAPFNKEICEDACFIWPVEEVVAFGVADGVSSWRYQGVDAAMFPNHLVANILNHLHTSKGQIDPQQLIDKAYHDVLDNNQVEAGSSTICIGTLNKQSGHLQTANLGDSGFIIYRDGRAIVKSQDQYIHPNVPFQIGVKEVKDGKSIPHGNSAADAAVCDFTLQPNDIVLAATDGLFENLFANEIFDILMSNKNSTDDSIDLNAAAKELAITAQERSVEPKRITPRERRLQKIDEYSLEIPGGNFDDVAVVILHVRDQ